MRLLASFWPASSPSSWLTRLSRSDNRFFRSEISARAAAASCFCTSSWAATSLYSASSLLRTALASSASFWACTANVMACCFRLRMASFMLRASLPTLLSISCCSVILVSASHTSRCSWAAAFSAASPRALSCSRPVLRASLASTAWPSADSLCLTCSRACLASIPILRATVLSFSSCSLIWDRSPLVALASLSATKRAACSACTFSRRAAASVLAASFSFISAARALEVSSLEDRAASFSRRSADSRA
mmetsp:Transcript_16757/g.36252  ORF Transcript_16757/g.36252 Transcript_16757/m.36252 type:complete len:249 (-) Transcript_16757:930-1676(-)